MKKIMRIFLLVLLLLLLAYSGILFSARLKQAMVLFAQTKGNTQLSLAFRNIINQNFSTHSEEFVTVERDQSNRITAIQIHSVALSLVASEMTVAILELLETFSSDDFGIPLGNLTASALLSGRGPLIPVRPVSAGNVASEIQSNLESAGINQTLHRVSIRFVITVKYLAPLEAYTDTIYVDFPVAETLIVGEVPILYRE